MASGYTRAESNCTYKPGSRTLEVGRTDYGKRSAPKEAPQKTSSNTVKPGKKAAY